MIEKTCLLIFLLSLLICHSCSNDDKERNEKTIRYIDLSDLTIFKGSADGNGEEVLFNNVKKVTLATQYFDTVFKPQLYKDNILDFNGGRLTYTFNESATRKIVSTYSFRNDSLFIHVNNTTESDNWVDKYVALGNDINSLYLRRSMVRYPLSAEKDTMHATKEIMDLEKVLELANINSGGFTDPNQQVAWCNMVYLY